MKLITNTTALMLLPAIVQAANIQAEAHGHETSNMSSLTIWFWVGLLIFYFIRKFFQD